MKALFDKENPKISFDNETLTVKIFGDIDHHCAKHIRESIDSSIFSFKPSTVLLDLSAVEFMDSSGLGLILGRFSTSGEMGAEFKIINPSRSVSKVLELAGIERIIKIEGNVKV